MGSETITFQDNQTTWAVSPTALGSQTITFGDNPTALAVRLLLFETIQQHRQSDCYFSRQPNMMGSQTITFQGNPTTWAVSATAWAVSPTAWAVRLLPFETIQRHGQSDYYLSRQSPEGVRDCLISLPKLGRTSRLHLHKQRRLWRMAAPSCSVPGNRTLIICSSQRLSRGTCKATGPPEYT